MNCDCPNCKKDSILNGTLKGNCSECKKELDALSEFYVLDKMLVCDDCKKEHYVECSICKKFHKKTTSKLIENSKICPSCFKQNYKECNCCHQYLNKHDIIGHDNLCYCRHCFDKEFQICCRCSAIYKKGIMTKHTVDDKIVCDKCWGIFGPIQQYNSKPKIQFYGKGPHFYGIELEVELENHVSTQRGIKAEEVINLFDDNFIITKEDGSLNVGFEIVTEPASLNEHRIRWEIFFNNMPKNLVSFGSKNCGLHIHCSRWPLSLLTIAKIVVFVNSEENQKFIETIAGRSSNSFSIIQKKEYGSIKKFNNSRYEAVNLCNKETIEFRIFKGTLKKESFFKAIEFCDATINFCNMATHSISFCKQKENFINYVSTKSKEYPHLNAFIDAKFLNKITKLTEKFGFSNSNDDSNNNSQSKNNTSTPINATTATNGSLEEFILLSQQPPIIFPQPTTLPSHTEDPATLVSINNNI